MELIDHRRSAIRSHFSPLQNQQSQQRQHHVFGYRQGTLHSSATPAPHLASSTYETIKILRSQVRELEMADEIGDVGQIRRRRRPKVTSAAPAPPVSPPPALEMQGSRPIGHSEGRDISMQISASSPTASSPTIDSQSSHAHNQLEQQNSISGEQQSGAQEQEGSSADLEGDDRESRQPRRLSPTFGGGERRRPEPEYYVGEVFRHLIYRYTGAIYGYDLSKNARRMKTGFSPWALTRSSTEETSHSTTPCWVTAPDAMLPRKISKFFFETTGVEQHLHMVRDDTLPRILA
ncbi:hypothetical protein EDD21DRAFT_222440 [Dissophora ornata]|nr:hypothetical protein EDD21DRAFT_222440 [Dissophora ornata]